MKIPPRQKAGQLFPSAEERDRIIQRRSRLMRGLIDVLAAHNTDPKRSDPQIRTLVAEYGAAEVERMQARIARQFQRPRDPDADEIWIYAEYVALHRRFGGARPLLAAEELDALKMERATLMLRCDFLGETLSGAEERRFAEITDLILADSDLWDDLVPEDPPRALQPLPPMRKPGRNAPCWCGSGRKYKHCHLRTDEAR